MIARTQEQLSDSLPHISVNGVIFRFADQRLEFAAARLAYDDLWMIAGGFIGQREDLNQAALRILTEQTGETDLTVRQFGIFGQADRNFLGEFANLTELGIPATLVEWISRRFITIGYYTVISDRSVAPQLPPYFSETAWLGIEEADRLGLDHTDLVHAALNALRTDLAYQPVLLDFFPDTLTLPQLQQFFESVLGRPVDRGNFRKRILRSAALVKVGQAPRGAGNRPPNLYRIDGDRYRAGLEVEVKLGF